LTQLIYQSFACIEVYSKWKALKLRRYVSDGSCRGNSREFRCNGGVLPVVKLCSLGGIADASAESADWCERATEHTIYEIVPHCPLPGFLWLYLFFGVPASVIALSRGRNCISHWDSRQKLCSSSG